MYKKFINSEVIQQYLVDPLRKGQTILPAIECYNTIDDHLLAIVHIEHAGKVLLDFLKNPKKFTFCRYPLLLCCLVAEFMIKLKRRFAVYESFFDQIYKGFITAGQLFAKKIKNDKILEYHLNRRDLKNRTCLQIMSQNRLYLILSVDNIGAIIGKYWSGNTVQYSLSDMSSFSYMLRYHVDVGMYFKDFTKDYNKFKQFSFNYYSYRDIVSIRYYFKELYNIFLVILYQALIYLAVVDKKLENTVNGTYPLLSWTTYIGSLALSLNKINSMIFFSFVNRWYIEIDPLFGEIFFIIAILFHIFKLKSWIIDETDELQSELVNAILLSLQISFLWWKVIDSLKATKNYGGFLRTVFLLVKKMFLLVCVFYCFIILCTGIFNLLFQQYTQFQTYFGSFFYLGQAALQQYSLDPQWTVFLNFFLMFFMGICTLILINLIIALATKIYDDVDDNIEPEHRGNLIKIYEYLNWDEDYGIFKFLHAPFSLIQLPMSILVLFAEDKKYWSDKFCKIGFFMISIIYFILFLFLELIKMPYVYIHYLLVQPIRYGNAFKKIISWILIGWLVIIVQFLIDIYKFWALSYRKQYSVEDDDKKTDQILEYRKLFSNLIGDISERVDVEKKLKKFSIADLVSGWLNRMSSKVNSLVTQDENNRMHKRTLILKKYKSSNSDTLKNEFTTRNSHANIFKGVNSKVTIFDHFQNILQFLTKFADKEGFIDKELAKNIFPKRDYYDDEYFEFLFYFNYKYFKTLIAKFVKNTNEIRREMNKLRGVLTDVQKINEKLNILKLNLKNIEKKNMRILSNGISSINTIFAILENNLLDAQTKDYLKNKMMNNYSASNKQSSAYQKQDANIVNRIQEAVTN